MIEPYMKITSIWSTELCIANLMSTMDVMFISDRYNRNSVIAKIMDASVVTWSCTLTTFITIDAIRFSAYLMSVCSATAINSQRSNNTNSEHRTVINSIHSYTIQNVSYIPSLLFRSDHMHEIENNRRIADKKYINMAKRVIRYVSFAMFTDPVGIVEIYVLK